MLVLSRRVLERVIIDGGIVVQVIEVKGDRVRLGFEAPKEIKINREEVLTAKPGVLPSCELGGESGGA